jgi:hypothetical protein
MGDIGETGDPGGGVPAAKKAWFELLLDRSEDGDCDDDSVVDEGNEDVADENDGRLSRFLGYDSPLATSRSSPSAYFRGGAVIVAAAAAVGSDEGVVTILGILTDRRDRGWLSAVEAEFRTTAVVESPCMLPAFRMASPRVSKGTECPPVSA